eukprot:1618707-Alexandrium_andersonii.AAC.1
MQSAIRPRPTRGSNPPQSGIRPAENAKSLRAFETGFARAQERPPNRSPTLLRGAFCTILRADSESAD